MTRRFMVVTGAAGSLGTAVVTALQQAGYAVIGIDQAATIPASALALSFAGADLTSPAVAADIFGEIANMTGELHGLVNVAGGFSWETIEGGDFATWDRLYALNLKTALVTCKTALPLLKAGRGSIVNVSASASAKAAGGMGAYAASKSSVSRLTEALAEELKDQHVRVNAVLPSIIDTAANRSDMPDAEFDRWVTPDDLANVICFLLSEQARAMTGALVPVTGRV